ncbi:MAG: puromycin-sensitive aminopeptidase, partial [Chloroflexota bacterium]|nr:puromycin-sensitive aminopeptidase [Chloroflexota bacterium]
MIADKRDFRLARDVRPSRYELHLELDLQDWTSTGRERVTIQLDRPQREITLHTTDLDILSAQLEGGPPYVRTEYETESQTATLTFAEEIPAGEHTLEIAWRGEISARLRGLYRSTRPGGERYAATQFEAADARRAFPCFDEPEFKARFAIELVHQSGLAAIGNASVAHQEILPDNRTLTRFAETQPISTYLVAFTVGPYQSTDEIISSTGWPVRVWLPPGLADKGIFARDTHATSVAWLEHYTGIPYPYGKLDAIGIPDFEAGAMENPGAITYRTRLLAADEATASTTTFKGIHSVISHELTHMWWGDLVTMAWWDDLWLNESFASFIGEKTVDALNPEWRYVRDIAQGAVPAFNLDQLVSTHPISVEVRNAEQASERFDAITYLKGQAVLRMIESFIGEDAFREGVRIYLRRHAEGNATASDFWRALDESSGRDVTGIANAWIHEPGHPVVSSAVAEDSRGLEVELRQQRFFADPDVPETPQLWPVPVVIKYGTAEGVHEHRLLLDGPRATVPLLGARWYYPNAGGRGFYRYALDDRSVALLAANVHQLEPEERMMLVDNQWALTRARRAQLSQLFELLAGLRGEDDRAVLDAIADPLTWLSTHAVGDEFRPAFERFVAEIFSPLLDKLGWDPRPTDTTDDRETRARVLGLLGRTAGLRTVQEEARRRIEAHLNGTQRLDPDLAGPLASVAATHGDAALYDRYVQRM